jgi:hypothetical protein
MLVAELELEDESTATLFLFLRAASSIRTACKMRCFFDFAAASEAVGLTVLVDLRFPARKEQSLCGSCSDGKIPDSSEEDPKLHGSGELGLLDT